MNLEELLKNMNPQMLTSAMKQMGKMVSQEQMEQVRKIITDADKGELNQRLNHLRAEDLKKELENNPALAKSLANNPEVMKKINQIFGQK